MEKVEQLDSSVTSNSMTDHNSKSLTSFEADRSFTEFCDENSRLVEDIRESPSPTSPYGKNVALVQPNNHRRSDEPTELSFEKFPENHEEKLKRIKIENALDDSATTQDEWRKFAKSEYGLINGMYPPPPPQPSTIIHVQPPSCLPSLKDVSCLRY
uniref:(northern house mosquito) hypothetical protein n=1 Tax=Culex pipiens TaxID=7175 RepID=A0A8D8NTI4_CULPI